MNKETENKELLQELEKRVKQGKITLEWTVVGCDNCDAEGAIGLTIKDYQLYFAELAQAVAKIKIAEEAKKIQQKSEMLKAFSDDDLRTEIDQREKKKKLKTHEI